MFTAALWALMLSTAAFPVNPLQRERRIIGGTPVANLNGNDGSTVEGYSFIVKLLIANKDTGTFVTMVTPQSRAWWRLAGAPYQRGLCYGKFADLT
jgi:hypothetical protein